MFEFRKFYDKTPILQYLAPQWFQWILFRYTSFFMILVCGIPIAIVNFGQALNFLYGHHASVLDRILKGYFIIQVSTGTVRYIFMFLFLIINEIIFLAKYLGLIKLN